MRKWIDKRGKVKERGGRGRERNPRPRQHLCPVLSVISSLLRKAFASTSPELSLSLSVTHTLSLSVVLLIYTRLIYLPYVCGGVDETHSRTGAVDGQIFGPLSICVCVFLPGVEGDWEHKSSEKTNYTEVGQYDTWPAQTHTQTHINTVNMKPESTNCSFGECVCVFNPITDQPLHTKEGKKKVRDGEKEKDNLQFCYLLVSDSVSCISPCWVLLTDRSWF